MSVTELRVHGVAGHSAEQILGRQHTTRVAGDAEAGFYRPTPPEDPRGPAGFDLEAYRWGSLTSGAAARALWLLLLPFTLANLTIWLRPAGRRGAGLCRLFALSLTGTFVLGISGVTIDLLGWQRGGGRWVWLGALGTAATIGLLWYLGRRTWIHYESYPANGDGFGEPSFWDGRALVGVGRALHVGAAFATLGAVVPGPAWGRWAAVAVLAGTGVATLLPGMADTNAPARWAAPFAGVLRTAGLLVATVVIGYAAHQPPEPRHPGALPGYAATVTWLFAAQSGLLLLLALRAGRTPALVGSYALWVTALFNSGLGHRVAGVLPGDPVLPAAYRWTALGFDFALLVGVVVVLIALRVLRRARAAARAVTDRDFPGKRATDPTRAGRIDAAIGGSRLTESARPLLLGGYVPLLLGALAATGLALADARVPTALVWAVNTGTWLIGAAVLALMALGLWAYSSQTVRRTVGALWDIGTFWPRAAHPLAPPCYAERAVPELAGRIRGLGDVVVVGDSQGSVLSFAALLHLGAARPAGAGLVTHGSPLTRVYSRYFPAWVNPGVLGRVAAPWANLWRDTDPLAGPVSAADNRRLVDPLEFTGPIHGHGGYRSDPAYVEVVRAAAIPR
ncbi:hypothetical protein R8Z50_03690 [Longispora sp. K20-0274]|uniref:hypothetical protein n=1 Tax=Longispora sp. K20-0274 TaxID=3088255 RepID=UPI00399ACAD3